MDRRPGLRRAHRNACANRRNESATAQGVSSYHTKRSLMMAGGSHAPPEQSSRPEHERVERTVAAPSRRPCVINAFRGVRSRSRSPAAACAIMPFALPCLSLWSARLVRAVAAGLLLRQQLCSCSSGAAAVNYSLRAAARGVCCAPLLRSAAKIGAFLAVEKLKGSRGLLGCSWLVLRCRSVLDTWQVDICNRSGGARFVCVWSKRLDWNLTRTHPYEPCVWQELAGKGCKLILSMSQIIDHFWPVCI
jgi:hypothetical protein